MFHAAFKIALLQIAMQRKLPHAGFVLIHSPFFDTHARDRDKTEEAKTAMRSKFYESLPELTVGQLIVVLTGKSAESLDALIIRNDFTEAGK